MYRVPDHRSHADAALLAFLTLLLLASCTGLRQSSVEQPLYTGFTIQWTSEPTFDGRGAERELSALVRPVANQSILGRRPAVALHNAVKEPEKKKGIKHWLKYKLGSPPVHLDALPLQDINAAMVNRMNNRGYFSARSSFEVVRHGRKASVTFTVEPGEPHIIRSLGMGAGNSGLDSALASMLPLSTVQAGEPYDLSRLTAERNRVTDRLRDHGWYRLRADDLIWAADTSVGGKRVDLHLRVKPGTSALKRRLHTIRSVTVHADQDEVLPPRDTVMVDQVRIINYLDMYRPAPILNGVLVRPGEAYSLRRTNAMQRYINSFGVFRNVLVAYADDTLREASLDAHIALMPLKRFSLFSELNAVSKSNNFAGPGVRFGIVDRNLLGGAEQLSVDLNGRFETQVSGADRGTNAYEIGLKAALAIPRMLLLPQPKGLLSSAPVTNISAGFGLFRRIDLYGMRSSAAGLSYSWHRGQRVWHDVQLLEVSYNDLFYTTPEFDAFLAENPIVKLSFEDQFIVGSGYTYTRSTRSRDDQRMWLVYSMGADASGNMLSAMFSLTRGDRPEEGYTLFNERFSQYIRLRPEVRWYKVVGGQGAQLVTRVLTHAGFSYGNTAVLPYVKQFFAGGTNSLRGFRARSVGPGTFVSQQEGNLLVDQVGDLKLEANMEYRFPISGFVKGALFADAGNVWLMRPDPSRPGGEFKWDTFVSEIALNAGFGVRVDPQVIVIRLDLAAPLRRPDLPAGDRWVFDDLDASWRRNLILNIAIGYPF
ncbi:MAG: BamA/TamA family outer membrane protein [Flavobacteriales bacterium]|nr:BamA/TamA family outer membrane protein [Flavobacteriales bacterium]